MHTKNDELRKPTNTFEIELICKRQIRFYVKNDNEVSSFIINLCAHFLNKMKKLCMEIRPLLTMYLKLSLK